MVEPTGRISRRSRGEVRLDRTTSRPPRDQSDVPPAGGLRTGYLQWRRRPPSTRAQANVRLAAQVAALTHPSLLVFDEIGYLPINHSGAVLFFQLMNRRYERASTVRTSNKGFGEWGENLGDEVVAATLIDRVLFEALRADP